MPLSDTMIILIGILAFGISSFTIYIVIKLIKQMKEEEKTYNEIKTKEVKKSLDFPSKKPKIEKKPKKTLGEVELKV